MELMEVKKLTPHPRNNYYFDDIAGENWDEFLGSVKTSGVIEPIIVTQDGVIVSGHQRVRACKELGIDKVAVNVRNYEDEDKVLKDLIETNIRQRGVGNPNAVKLGRCIKELERIYGVKVGRPKEISAIGGNLSQEDLAKRLGISVDTLNRAKSLASLPAEIQQMIEDGKITPSTASRVIARLSEDEQAELIKGLEPGKRYMQAEIQGYIDKIKELERRKPEKVVPADYEGLKTECGMFKRQYDEMAAKWKKSEAEKNALLKEKAEPDVQRAERARISAAAFNAGIANFIERYGGYIWITEYLDIIPESYTKDFLSGVNALTAWVSQLRKNLLGKNLGGNIE